MEELNKKLEKLGWDMEELLAHLDKVINKKQKDSERHKRYFRKNRQKLYNYHEQWRNSNPDYLERKRLRERERSRNNG